VFHLAKITPYDYRALRSPEISKRVGEADPAALYSAAMKIYTKTGDQGSTGLFGGGRVPKDDVRVEAYGDVDELNAVIGMARSVEMMPRIDEVLVPIQRDLFAIGALLATPNREKMAQHLEKARIDEARIAELEHAIDDGEAELEPLTAFILPGGTPKAAALHVARTVCRRAERHVVSLQHEVELPPLAIIYLNRLSDLLFTLARVANRRAGAGEVTW
jgi:cob(I)alamin adenosyltransferase